MVVYACSWQQKKYGILVWTHYVAIITAMRHHGQ